MRFRRFEVALITICMLLTFCCLGAGMTKAYAEDGTITRVQWLHELTSIFGMTVEADNYPDNYYSDIDSSSEYYHDVMLATEFGLIDVEAGEQFKPDEPVSREFAAHTLNLCIGYVLEEETYTFSESASVTYPNDIQVAINHGWLGLNDGAFEPELAITAEEAEKMFAVAAVAASSTTIDEDYNSTWEYAQGVVEISENAVIELTADNQITISNSETVVNDGDIFAFVLDGFPMAYKADSVVVSGINQIISVSDVSQEEAFAKIDVQGSVKADLSEVVSDEENIAITYIVGGTEANNYEDGTKYYSQADVAGQEVVAIEVTKEYALPSEVSKKFELAEGVEAVIGCKITNVGRDYYSLKSKAYTGVYGDLEFSCNVSMDVLEAIGVESDMELIRVPIQGNFVYLSVALDAELNGEVNFNLVEHVSVGVEVEDGAGCRLVRNFYKKEFTVEADVKGKIGVTVSAVVNAGVIKGTLYGKIGADMHANAKSNGCVHFSAYLYASVGAKVNVNVIFYKNEWGKEITLWNIYNSPVRIVFHYEDGVEVTRCTRDDTSSETTSSGSSQYKYYSPVNTRYGYNGASSGLDAEGNPYTIFDYKLNDDNTAVITGYYGNVSTLKIPAKLDGYTVVGIAKDVFRAKALRVVVIPDSITSIEKNAFRGCTNLSSVTLSKNLAFLDYNAFALCNSLRSIEIPKSLTDANATHLFGDNNISYGGPFNECVNLKTVTFEEGTEMIADDLFYNCIGLEQIIIPDSVVEIGDEAFKTCENLKKVVLSDNLEIIGDNAFYDCGAISEIILPQKLVEISGGAFRATGLKKIIIPDSVVTIGKNAFRECTDLSSVKLSKNLVTLDYNAFARCNLLTSIEIPKSLTESQATHLYGDDIEAGGPFNECENLTTIILEDGMTEVADGLFSNCRSVCEVVIPDTVTKIGNNAFKSCDNLAKVTIPASVISIGRYVFTDTENVTIYGVEGTYAEEYAIANEIEFVAYAVDQVAAFVERMYTVALNRPSDAAGKANWVGMLNAGTHDGAGLAREFILGEEFALRGLSDEQYVDVLYHTFFNREADAGGKELWLAVLASGQTRAYVLSNFVNLDEFTILCDSYGIERGVMFENGTAANPGIPKFVKRLYNNVLGRDAEAQGLYNNVIALVVKAETAESTAKNFFGSAEYALKNTDNATYVKDLYKVFMDRAADESGLSFWVSCIEVGMTRDDILSEFAKSAEFKIIAASYGLE